ncbi:MAG: hypothetical protein RSB71_04460 [Bacilli bacterium]
MNEKNLRKAIMEQRNHQFIYGYNGKIRADILKRIALKYPIILSSNKPMGIYIPNVGLPQIQTINKLDNNILIKYNQLYCELQLITSILTTLINQTNGKTTLNKNYIKSSYQLCTSLNETKNNCYKEYLKYLQTGKVTNFIKTTTSFKINEFLNDLKQCLNNHSYFGIIIDEQRPISIKSQMIINGFLNYNEVFSLKIACQIEQWQTYNQINGLCNIFDTVEIDNNYEAYTKKLKIVHKEP